MSGMKATSSQILKTSEVTVTYSGGSTNNLQELGYKAYEGGRGGKKMLGHKRSTTSSKNGPQRTHFVRSAGVDPNKAALKYTKCALLFFIALIITWVPSTVNRVSTFLHPGEVNFALNYATALVLPLQGLWNSLIYTATSSYGVNSLLQDIAATFKKPKINVSMAACWADQQRQEGEQVVDQPNKPVVHHIHDRTSSQADLVGNYV